MSMGLLRSHRLATGALLVSAASAVTACGAATQEVRTVRGAAAPVAAADPGPLARASSAFGLSVLDAWCRRDPSANVVLSPSSLSSGLGMVHQAARGETAAAMARTLRLPPGDLLPALRARTGALKALNTRDVKLRTVDQVWADRALTPNRDYLDRVATAYDASLKLLDVRGDPEGARATVNEEIKKITEGLVPRLLPENSVRANTGWILTDALYLKARWAAEFKKQDTAPAPFTTAAGRRVDTPMMRRTTGYGVARHRGWTAVDLPYRDGRLSMTALLPDTRAGGCPGLSPATLDALTGALRPTTVDLSIPKVRLKTQADLKPLLGELGMARAFGDGADLRGLSPRAVRLQFVQHAATLLVDERGTEAAAATGSGVEALAAPPRGEKIVFDRPHVLVVRDTRTGEPLFLARVADPTRS
ncbi:serpin family protein [Actinomadura kijaniata]